MRETNLFDQSAGKPKETAILVAIHLPDVSQENLDESLEELEALAKTAGAEVCARVVQKRESVSPSMLVGKGKALALKELVEETGADLVIFDREITSAQQQRLESLLEAKVLGRTALILDIFAQHAHTNEGRIQVELAQLSYMFPRMRGKGTQLSRLGGGIGTRGPGEMKLEVDRRRVRKRMKKLSGELDHMVKIRQTQRKRRSRKGLASVCMVGYTNSGKSSLLNALTDAEVKVEDQLFSTLDSTTRRLFLKGHGVVLLSDTVGFIRKLPHELVAAFQSTLEVVMEADLLLHVIDAKNVEAIDEKIKAVERVLGDLGASNIPRIMVFNKIDLLDSSQRNYLKRKYPQGFLVSALRREGFDELLGGIDMSVGWVKNKPLSPQMEEVKMPNNPTKNGGDPHQWAT
ncbi:MAG: GTPase HflX [Actinomycetota bacterium]|nr:GTPase HflX [Actinomycetota bacterium]